MVNYFKELLTNPLGYYNHTQSSKYGLKIFALTFVIAVFIMLINEYIVYILSGEVFTFSGFFFELIRFTLLNSFLIFLLLFSTPPVRSSNESDRYTNHLVAGSFVNILIVIIHATGLLLAKGNPSSGLIALLPIGGFMTLVLWPFFIATLAMQSANLSIFLKQRFGLNPLAGIVYGLLSICLSFIIAFSSLI